MKTLSIHFGALSDPIAKQVKSQGFQFNGKQMITFQDQSDAILKLRFAGILTDSMIISWHDALKAMREFSDTKNAIFKSALDEISNPIKYMQLRAEEKGHSLNGIMAIQISKDPEYLKSIAEKAINNQGLSHE